MAEAPQQQHQPEEEEEEQPSTVETTDTDEGSEEPKESVQVTPTRPLLSMRSMSSVDPDDDSPNMIVYRKVGAKTVFYLTGLPSAELCALPPPLPVSLKLLLGACGLCRDDTSVGGIVGFSSLSSVCLTWGCLMPLSVYTPSFPPVTSGLVTGLCLATLW